MDKAQLEEIIYASGGVGALEYAQSLLEMINRLEKSEKYSALLRQFYTAREEGDFRGRVFEINFAHHFSELGVELDVGVSQGGTGDIDFCWQIDGNRLFIELKLLGERRRIRDELNARLEEHGEYFLANSDDLGDVRRIQRDIFAKGSTRKFKFPPDRDAINLIGIDVSELQHGTVDLADCLLAAVGNSEVARHCGDSYCRPQVVGVFEHLVAETASAEQRAWVDDSFPSAEHDHPRSYIHGVLFLFREPKERAALRYQIRGAIVWNPALINEDRAESLARAVENQIPRYRTV